MLCTICPRKCNVDRDKYQGFCGMSNKIKLAKVGRFDWEEPCISGKNGSGAIFFSGCNLKCVFCQNYKISSGGFGKEITINRLVQIYKELEKSGVNNINLVSPTQYTNQILQSLKIYKPSIPVIWNSNGYEDINILEQLRDYVDIFIVDIKFFEPDLAKRFCKAGNYPKCNQDCIKKMLQLQPDLIWDNDLLKKGVIIRHLVMPNCTNDSIKICDFLAKLGNQHFLFSLMGQYTPYYLAKNDELINRKLKPIEYKRVVNYAISHNLNNGYIQELDSANEVFIPDFDLSGV